MGVLHKDNGSFENKCLNLKIKHNYIYDIPPENYCINQNKGEIKWSEPPLLKMCI